MRRADERVVAVHSGRGGGTTAPGRLLLRMAPRAIGTLAARLRSGVALISATNGKTTTARMLAAILEADGRTVVHNRAGANTQWGVSTALAEGEGDIGVFEVDEAWLPLLARELRPRLIVLGNLSRDRLDGYGELERLVSLWRELLRGSAAKSPRIVPRAGRRSDRGETAVTAAAAWDPLNVRMLSASSSACDSSGPASTISANLAARSLFRLGPSPRESVERRAPASRSAH